MAPPEALGGDGQWVHSNIPVPLLASVNKHFGAPVACQSPLQTTDPHESLTGTADATGHKQEIKVGERKGDS